MTCPVCDKPRMTFQKVTVLHPNPWFHCRNCTISFDDPKETVGEHLYNSLVAQHRNAVNTGDESAKIRRGWEIRNRKTDKMRLLTWIEIGAITGAI
jgi:hypothetical protein